MRLLHRALVRARHIPDGRQGVLQSASVRRRLDSLLMQSEERPIGHLPN